MAMKWRGGVFRRLGSVKRLVTERERTPSPNTHHEPPAPGSSEPFVQQLYEVAGGVAMTHAARKEVDS